MRGGQRLKIRHSIISETTQYKAYNPNPASPIVTQSMAPDCDGSIAL